MLTIGPEYLRLRAARLRRSAMNLGSDPEAEKVWQLVETMETLAVEMEARGTQPPPRPSAPVRAIAGIDQ
jgi:hypothetical protein